MTYNKALQFALSASLSPFEPDALLDYNSSN